MGLPLPLRRLHLVRSLVVLAALAGCVSPLPDRFPPRAGAAGNHVVWVVSHGWHTGIVVARAEAQALLPALDGERVSARYLEFGWGDIGYYTAPAESYGLMLAAAVASRGTVLHVVALDAPPAEAFPNAEVEAITVSDAGFRAMLARIAAAFRRDAAGGAIALGPGLYGASRFYRANGTYWAGYTCNTWVAATLRETGCPITPAYAMSAGNVMFQARRYCRVDLARARPAP